MAKIERSPATGGSHFIYVSDTHMEGKWIPIHSKRDLLMLIKLASESLQMLEDMQDE
jgi:predicted RNA binding protein YcfA (HicA-like mRNA interferase family)